MAGRRGVLAVVLAVILGGGAVAWILVSRSDDGSDGTSASSNDRADGFPSASKEVAEQTATYLDGDGAALLVMHRAARDIAGSPGPDECADVTETLDREAPPDAMLGLAAGVPDEVLGAAFTAERRELGGVLARCLADSEDISADHTVDLVAAADVVDSRIAQLGAVE